MTSLTARRVGDGDGELPNFADALADKIRVAIAERKRTGASSRRIALALGQEPSYVSRRLNGHVPWTAAEIAVVARVLECSVQELQPAPGDYCYCINSISVRFEPADVA